ncbi:DUF4241 domain-containing protein [Actinophytocola sp. NPDC049390]|uniref:DUF4241 domain-containing protein n=1 Tax=Actinophytocola sp. NPDC049390 TaxID=3363894 RepID=UPI0037A27BA8
MAEGVSRRTVLLSGGALAALLAGGVLAVSNARRTPDTPSFATPDLDDLPVADVPAPTTRPVAVVYCAGWDAAARVPVSPMSEAVARAQDTAGAQYAVVAFVDGKARAVVEVCWSAHHAELWNVDDRGRRYRGVAYRRWPDERLRLFEVRSWHYPEPGTPEFDGDEPAFRARALWDGGEIDRVDISVARDDGLLELVREGADWPEPVRPEQNMAVPAVGDWPTLAGTTGPVTVRSGPDAVPDRFPWRPPRPLRPRHVTEMTTEGTRFTTEEGEVLTIERVGAGTIRLPSGRLVVADPGWLDADSVALADAVPPGEYPVDVFRVDKWGSVACRVRVTDAPVASWHLALRDGDDELALGDGEFYGNPVDTATIGLVDADGVSAYQEAEIEDVLSRASERAYRTISDPETGTDLVVVAGWTDGAYPTWLGRTEDGAIACFVVDFMIPDVDTGTPG